MKRQSTSSYIELMLNTTKEEIQRTLLQGEPNLHEKVSSISEYWHDRIDKSVAIIAKHEIDKFKILLRSKNFNINKQDSLGATLLMYAAALGYYDIVRLLLEYNADPLIQTKDGRTVFDVVLNILSQNSLSQEQRTCYEWVLQRCQNAVCDHYLIPIQLACLTSNNKKIPKPVVLQHIVAPMIGIVATKFQPANPPSHPNDLPALPPSGLIPARPVDNVLPQTIQPNKAYSTKSFAIDCLIGSLFASYLWYCYSSVKKPAKPVEDLPAQNTTNTHLQKTDTIRTF